MCLNGIVRSMSLSLEYRATLVQNERIADALRERGVPRVDLIENPLGEPLAVHLPEFFDPAEYKGDVPDTIKDREVPVSRWGWDDEVRELRNAFPMVSNRLLVPQIAGLLDTVVQTIAGEEFLATSITEWDDTRVSDDSGPHVDFPNTPREDTDPLIISGHNAHFSPNEPAVVRMGILREFASLLRIQSLPSNEKQRYYREQGAPFVEFSIRPGAGLLFQGGSPS